MDLGQTASNTAALGHQPASVHLREIRGVVLAPKLLQVAVRPVEEKVIGLPLLVGEEQSDEMRVGLVRSAELLQHFHFLVEIFGTGRVEYLDGKVGVALGEVLIDYQLVLMFPQMCCRIGTITLDGVKLWWDGWILAFQTVP